MEILIHNNNMYKDVTIGNGSTHIDLGLLDKKESIVLARELIEAAYLLLPADKEEVSEILCSALEKL